MTGSKSLSGDGEGTISRSKAEEVLMSELQYSRERAQFIVKQFDKNGDGKLSAKEMERFKTSVKQTSVAFEQILSKLLLPTELSSKNSENLYICNCVTM